MYTTQGDWESAIGGASNATVEDFSDTTLIPGLTITSGYSGFSLSSGGQMLDQINSATSPTVFTFTTPMYAFGGNWNLSGPGGSGTGIQVTYHDGSTQTLSSEISNSLSGGFWGFVSTTSFLSVTLLEGTQASGVETYHLDNLRLSAVPEPATLALFGLGAAGLALRRRKQRAA